MTDDSHINQAKRLINHHNTNITAPEAQVHALIAIAEELAHMRRLFEQPVVTSEVPRRNWWARVMSR
jgi:hypothetical protein